MKKISMYEVTHKKVNYIPKGRTPILVGNSENIENYLMDNTEDNISFKNKNFCELTAMYWIWKNDNKSDYISIEHYRRFFLDKLLLKPISYKKIQKILKKYDVVVTKEYVFKESIREYYKKHHCESDLNAIEDSINRLYPDYLNVYNEVLNGNKTSMCNMIIMNEKNYNKYCEWLFNILFDVEKHITLDDRNDYQKRVFGFMSERLQNVWIKYNNLNVKRLPIYYLESNKLCSIMKSLKHIF